MCQRFLCVVWVVRNVNDALNLFLHSLKIPSVVYTYEALKCVRLRAQTFLVFASGKHVVADLLFHALRYVAFMIATVSILPLVFAK